jgi:hypothetical protein
MWMTVPVRWATDKLHLPADTGPWQAIGESRKSLRRRAFTTITHYNPYKFKESMRTIYIDDPEKPKSNAMEKR